MPPSAEVHLPAAAGPILDRLERQVNGHSADLRELRERIARAEAGAPAQAGERLAGLESTLRDLRAGQERLESLQSRIYLALLGAGGMGAAGAKAVEMLGAM